MLRPTLVEAGFAYLTGCHQGRRLGGPGCLELAGVMTGNPRLPCGEQEHQVTGTKAGTAFFSLATPLLWPLRQLGEKVVTGGQASPDAPESFLKVLSCTAGQPPSWHHVTWGY